MGMSPYRALKIKVTERFISKQNRMWRNEVNMRKRERTREKVNTLAYLNSNFESLLTEFPKMTEVGVVGEDRGAIAISPLYNSPRLVP